MRIIRYQLLSEIETLDRLRNVRLKGHGEPFVYRQADLQVIEKFPTELLVPPQRYVLSPTIAAILELADAFEWQYLIDIFSLKGALLFWTEDMDPNGDPIPFLPPIVEESVEETGRIMLVNDGMHRVTAARKRGRRPNIIFVSNLPPEYPYYAYPFEGGWADVTELAELSDGFQKKNYRYPDNYKALFRQFNAVFPGVQAQRKQSNPASIRE